MPKRNRKKLTKFFAAIAIGVSFGIGMPDLAAIAQTLLDSEKIFVASYIGEQQKAMESGADRQRSTELINEFSNRITNLERSMGRIKSRLLARKKRLDRSGEQTSSPRQGPVRLPKAAEESIKNSCCSIMRNRN